MLLSKYTYVLFCSVITLYIAFLMRLNTETVGKRQLKVYITIIISSFL